MESKEIISYMLFDGRYLNNPDSAVCYEVCDSLKEARENKDDYGTDTVIVKATSKCVGKGKYEIKSQEIVNENKEYNGKIWNKAH